VRNLQGTRLKRLIEWLMTEAKWLTVAEVSRILTPMLGDSSNFSIPSLTFTEIYSTSTKLKDKKYELWYSVLGGGNWPFTGLAYRHSNMGGRNQGRISNRPLFRARLTVLDRNVYMSSLLLPCMPSSSKPLTSIRTLLLV
jgi:hypothetical protein